MVSGERAVEFRMRKLKPFVLRPSHSRAAGSVNARAVATVVRRRLRFTSSDDTSSVPPWSTHHVLLFSAPMRVRCPIPDDSSESF